MVYEYGSYECVRYVAEALSGRRPPKSCGPAHFTVECLEESLLIIYCTQPCSDRPTEASQPVGASFGEVI
jgi:hypothetical protein